MAGAGTETVLRQAERLAVDHGGDAADWSKVTSSYYTAADGQKIQTHAYQNEKIGKSSSRKLKLIDEAGYENHPIEWLEKSHAGI